MFSVTYDSAGVTAVFCGEGGSVVKVQGSTPGIHGVGVLAHNETARRLRGG